MPLDPQAKVLLDQLEMMGAPPMDEQTPEGLRESYAMLAGLDGEPDKMANVEDRTIPGRPVRSPCASTPPKAAGRSRSWCSSTAAGS